MTEGLEAARAALAGRRAWLVGGAVRDRALGRGSESADVDVVVEGDPGEAARAIAAAAGGAACFALSEEFGAWRVVARDGSWQVDVEPLRGGSLEGDLRMRDFTVNAIAEPIEGGEPIDPLGGLADLAARRLRMAGPSAFAEDPLRVLRLARAAVELDLEPEDGTLRAAVAAAPGLADVSPERVFTELRRIIATARAPRGLEMLSELRATGVVLPELEALRGVEQNRYHHRDVHGHTLEVLERVVELTEASAGELDRMGTWVAGHGVEVASLLAEPLADGLTRGEALRWGALLHDAAKPLTRETPSAGGRVTFIGHDVRGAELARSVLGRLRSSERLRAHVGALVRHHLRAGFLVHEPQPLSRQAVYAYMAACSPVQADVTLLSVADRLATRGDRAEESIDAHLRVAGGLLAAALMWHSEGPPRPLLRGDELAELLGVEPGPRIGELLNGLAEAQYAGEVSTRAQAVEYLRTLAGSRSI
ncbi:MAG TPA: HD domain-containing protein [Solirubrobacteraceae bacterium]|nr:HD domain-containing protein [Solirubrobacteraceae bacterium]